MSALLTAKKQAWARQFKPKTLEGPPVTANAGDMEWYAIKLENLTAAMAKATEKAITRLFKADAPDLGYSEDASISSQARMLLSRLMERFTELFTKKSKELAEGMIKRAMRSTSAGVTMSLKELSGGLVIKTSISADLEEKLKAAVTANTKLIRNLKDEYYLRASDAVMRSITTGNGLHDLVPELQKLGDMTRRRAHFIALDQTQKANAFIAREKYAAAGVNYFRWVHTDRARTPRPLHVALDGLIFRHDEPPVIDVNGTRGYPGDLINCHCRMKPVMQFDEGVAET